jgi:hypothetical protein
VADNFQQIQATVRNYLSHYNSVAIVGAGTTDLGANVGLIQEVSGAATITSFGTVSAGIWKIVRFQGASVLTHAASLVLPGTANITCAAGDWCLAYSKGSGNWEVPFFQRLASVPPSAAVAAGPPYTDTTTLVKGSADTSKLLRFEVDGFTAGNTRIGTPPNHDFWIMPQNHGADVTATATINLDTTTGDLIDVTGTDAVTAITLAEGRTRTIRFTGILTLTNGASLVLPGGANITTAAGDFAIFRGYAAGVVRCVSYSRLSGQSVISRTTLGTSQATTAGTAITFSGIPAGTKQIILSLVGVSTNGTSQLCVQIGDAGGLELAGYLGSCSRQTGAVSNFTTEFRISQAANAAASVWHGQVILTLVDAATFTWSATSMIGTSNAADNEWMAGTKSLSAELTQLALTTLLGADTFDAGVANILYIT